MSLLIFVIVLCSGGLIFSLAHISVCLCVFIAINVCWRRLSVRKKKLLDLTPGLSEKPGSHPPNEFECCAFLNSLSTKRSF